MDLTTNQLGVLALIWAIVQWWLQRRDARSKLATSEAEALKTVAAQAETIRLKNEEIEQLRARVNHLESLAYTGGILR